MNDFYHKRTNVLVATTIIETGIDVPSANTILIERADKFGLAQLHQLRGRVGRSHHQAYAYLLVPSGKKLTPDAEKRLEAISNAQDLGAGFVLATHDLEIRGAGELLGDGQSGQIQSVGFTLYMEMLERAVQAIKKGEQPDLEQPLNNGAQVSLRVPALIPEDYLPDVHSRLMLYNHLVAGDEEALKACKVEMMTASACYLNQPRTCLPKPALSSKRTSSALSRLMPAAKAVVWNLVLIHQLIRSR